MARSRWPDLALRRWLPGQTSALTVIPLAMVGLVTGEFPRLVLTAEACAALRHAARGALSQRRGRLGAIVAAAAWIGLVRAYHDQLRSRQVLRDALATTAHTASGQGGAPPGQPHRLGIVSPRSVRTHHRRHTNVPYGPAGVRNHLDVWSRGDLAAGQRAPVMLYVPGSGWVAGGKRGQGHALLSHLAQAGWVCVSINYSLAPTSRWPAHIIDVKRAIGWIKAEIGRYGGDPGFVAVAGGSVGGQLAALAALSANDPTFQPGFEDVDTSVAAAVTLYGVYDLLNRHGDAPPGQREFLERFVMDGSPEIAPAVWHAGSPLSRVHPCAPPFFVLHGSVDTITSPDQAETFAATLRAVSRAPVLHARLPGAQHMFDAVPSARTLHTVRAIGDFLDTVRHAGWSGSDGPTAHPPEGR